MNNNISNNQSHLYTNKFFKNHLAKSLSSAELIVPEILHYIQPKSVIDFGCGIGTFLSVFYKTGITDILGIDGDYVDRNNLLIDKKYFLPRDLTQPMIIDKKYDLALSLEVAEHLPESKANVFITSLCSASPFVVFSAAVPHQGGTNHINEQWPPYWINKFKEHGFVAIDCIRPKIWNNTDIAFWYRQNILVFVAQNKIADFPALEKWYNLPYQPLSIVHPEQFQTLYKRVKWADAPLQLILNIKNLFIK